MTKVTIEPVLCAETYPQPRREDLFAELVGGQSFTKLDLAEAYLQMEVKSSSRKFLTIDTQKASSNTIALYLVSPQHQLYLKKKGAIETILQGIPGVLVYQDDILITGKSQASHEESLHRVLSRLKEHDLRLKISKCKFCFCLTFLILVHANIKWPEVIPMTTGTSQTTIEALRSIFSRFGIPQQLVSDNGSHFTSSEFATFMSENGIRHIRTAHFHPSSNGLAERFVQSFKQAMKSAKATEKSINKHLSAFLLA